MLIIKRKFSNRRALALVVIYAAFAAAALFS